VVRDEAEFDQRLQSGAVRLTAKGRPTFERALRRGDPRNALLVRRRRHRSGGIGSALGTCGQLVQDLARPNRTRNHGPDGSASIIRQPPATTGRLEQLKIVPGLARRSFPHASLWLIFKAAFP